MATALRLASSHPVVMATSRRDRRHCHITRAGADYVGKIIVDSSPKREMLEALRVSTWPTWSAEESEFPWQYDTTESCLILEGSAIVTPDAKHGAEEVVIAAGDFCIFPKGLSCTWKVISRISKHYCFE